MAINISGLCKSFGVKEKESYIVVLDNVTLTVDDGEMVAICGKSGSGKSTLLHIMGLLDRPTSGEYSIGNLNSEELKNEKKSAAFRNEKVGFVLQDFGLIEDDTVFNNVSLPLMLGKTPLRHIGRMTHEILKSLGMDEYSESVVSKLSGGEKQRVAIARALVNDPDYIFADEPTGALDTENTKMIMEIFKKIHKKGKTIIIVTHDKDVADCCDRTINIVDGSIYSYETKGQG